MNTGKLFVRTVWQCSSELKLKIFTQNTKWRENRGRRKRKKIQRKM